MRQWATENNNDDEADTRKRELEERLEAMKEEEGYLQNRVETATVKKMRHDEDIKRLT